MLDEDLPANPVDEAPTTDDLRTRGRAPGFEPAPHRLRQDRRTGCPVAPSAGWIRSRASSQESRRYAIESEAGPHRDRLFA